MASEAGCEETIPLKPGKGVERQEHDQMEGQDSESERLDPNDVDDTETVSRPKRKMMIIVAVTVIGVLVGVLVPNYLGNEDGKNYIAEKGLQGKGVKEQKRSIRSSFRLGCFNSTADLGMTSGTISDSDITASSAISSHSLPKFARLGNSKAWIADRKDLNPWIQVNLRKAMNVTAIAIQGFKGSYVRQYYLSYSVSGYKWRNYTTQAVTKVFHANDKEVATVALDPLVVAQYIRLYPIQCSRYCSLRMELYGCNSVAEPKWSQWSSWGECSKTCGNGTRVRSRECVTQNRQAVFAPISCAGKPQQTQNCSQWNCPEPKWSPWSSWSECTKTCGNGTRVRSRVCVARDPQAYFAPISCAGKSQKRQNCSQWNCPEPKWSRWSSWSECSKTCGNGTRVRSRVCVAQNRQAVFAPISCAGKPQQPQNCFQWNCPEPKWSRWGSWSKCTKTCGNGTRVRSRVCVAQNPQAYFAPTSCSGRSQKRQNCSQWNCPDPKWSRWSSWSKCTKTCGNGTRVRSRVCVAKNRHTVLEPISCSGNGQETRKCSQWNCPEAKWSGWSSWSDCTKTCGFGTRLRSRVCVAQNGQAGFAPTSCAGKSQQTQNCSQWNCPEAKWSRWSSWSVCTVTCGSGTRLRSRVCVVQAPTSCAGKPQQTQNCSQWNCPDCLKTCIKGTLNAACDACTCDNHKLTGRVQAKNGAPISGAKVTLSETPYNVLAQTDDKGFFKAFNVCTDANQELLISRRGFVPMKLQATVLTSTTADVKAQLDTSVPPSITVHPQSKMRFSGDSVTFCCDGEGNPPPEFEWFKDDNIIDKAIYHYDKNLEISDVSDLAGKYRCRVVNDFGSEFSDAADLKVFGARDAATCSPTPTSKHATLPAGCVIHGTTNNILDIGECEPTPCLRNDSNFSAETCQDQNLCCAVEEVSDVTISCGDFAMFNLSKVARCGCQKCEERNAQITGTVVGRKGITEKPIAYCDVEVEGRSYSADRNGIFTFKVPRGKQRLSVVFKDTYDEEYADGIKVFHITKGQTLFSKIVLKPKPVPKPFNSFEDFKVELGDNYDDSAFAEMEVPKNALLKDDGTTFTGQASLRLNVIDPRNRNDIVTAPGDFSAIDEDGEEQMLVSYGMLSFDFEDDSGNKLSPSKPIKLYLDPEKLNIPVDDYGNTKTKLWWLDVKTGRWIEAGDLRVEKENYGRRRRSRTRFILGTKISPPIARQRTFNIDLPANFGAVRVVGPVESTVTILCKERKENPPVYNGYLEETIGRLKVACISVWINKTCYIQARDVHSQFLLPDRSSLSSSPLIEVVSGKYLNVKSFKFEVKPTLRGPVFLHNSEGIQRCRDRYQQGDGLQQFKFKSPKSANINLNLPRPFDAKDPLNWYPVDTRIRVCYIKILVRGKKTTFLAYSHKPYKGKKYGHFVGMAEPAIDKPDSYVACLQIRCPGRVFDVNKGKQVLQWTHVRVVPLNGRCKFQKNRLRKKDQNNIDGKKARCPTRSSRWLCIPVSYRGFQIYRVYSAEDRNNPKIAENRCKLGDNQWSPGKPVQIKKNGATADFSCR